jgi:hypothetical protein
VWNSGINIDQVISKESPIISEEVDSMMSKETMVDEPDQ